MAVLKETFNIQVEHYAKVNFNSFITIVDAIGGLDMYLTVEEIWWLNDFSYSPEMTELFPDYKRSALPEKEGVYRLSGLQCLGHARNRRVGSDWARTERQRNLIGQMVTQAKELSLSQLDNLLDKTLPLITTNIPKDRLKELVGGAFSYLKFEMISTRIPLNGLYHEVNYNIIPDLPANCNDLYEKIYSEKPPVSQVK
jgi:anionic cell wall polymer biosynthesis LytR-Cps2A-Psr (LCP) family protein